MIASALKTQAKTNTGEDLILIQMWRQPKYKSTCDPINKKRNSSILKINPALKKKHNKIFSRNICPLNINI